MLPFIYLIISLAMSIASFIMFHHNNKITVRAFGIVLAYIAAGIALKAYYMISPQ